MSAITKKKLSEAEYFAIERAAEFKSEFYNGEMFPMTGFNRQHNEIKENLIVEIGGHLKGGPCRSLSADMRVKIERTGLYTYPDLLIVCGKPELDPEHQDILYNPKVIIEILSESTESYDRGKKFLHYRQLSSLREYILVSQEQKLVERFVRQPDDTWLLTTFDDPDGEFALSTVPVRVPMADVYRGVEPLEEPLR
ncbi:MAG TPA: Uma2 family endonuclease [Gemmata sp.]|jgi:Uma2 family endonuclease|nr:Uma2 family endonuclease [Gemmata sp.]